MNEKDKMSPIFVYLAIVFLAMFIVVPPFFRMMYPRENTTVVDPIEKKSHRLSCEKISTEEKLKIISNVEYDKGVIVRNTISYANYSPSIDEELADDAPVTDNTTGDNTTTDGTNSDTVVDEDMMTALEEIEFFKGIDNIEISESSAETVVIITKAVIENNSDNIELVNYFLPSEEQQAFYYDRGFTCSIIEQ